MNVFLQYLQTYEQKMEQQSKQQLNVLLALLRKLSNSKATTQNALQQINRIVCLNKNGFKICISQFRTLSEAIKQINILIFNNIKLNASKLDLIVMNRIIGAKSINKIQLNNDEPSGEAKMIIAHDVDCKTKINMLNLLENVISWKIHTKTLKIHSNEEFDLLIVDKTHIYHKSQVTKINKKALQVTADRLPQQMIHNSLLQQHAKLITQYLDNHHYQIQQINKQLILYCIKQCIEINSIEIIELQFTSHKFRMFQKVIKILQPNVSEEFIQSCAISSGLSDIQSIQISTTDPITLMPIKTPVRSLRCQHLQVFEEGSYNKCPFCQQFIMYGDLYVDNFLQLIIQNYSSENYVKCIDLNPNTMHLEIITCNKITSECDSWFQPDIIKPILLQHK
ncbi:RING/FYVE/PHD-type [Hexamita inflata]|uniref:RING/FYVE/PHD-type n=1 Tax=Hexamita inflata TaxID=28002 RepID=A0AA86PVK9_9EUKA|nr:RING/FYVE/PHD-type [Hexamita inflata]